MPQKLIKRCQEILKEKRIDCYVVPTSDFHNSEYVGEFFKLRKFLSGFTGSAGTLVICREKAALWTDGRYFIQAESELAGTEIELMKSGLPGVPLLEEYLKENIPEDGILAFDGRVVTWRQGNLWRDKLRAKNVIIRSNLDMADLVWKDRPALPDSKLYRFEDDYAGRTYVSKLGGLLKAMKERNATIYIDSALDNIAWMLNIRGNDVECNPVVLSYLLITEKDTILYVDKNKLGDNEKIYFRQVGIAVKEYFEIYEDVYDIKNERVWVDGENLNYELYSALQGQNTMVDRRSPITLSKAMKNQTETANLRRAHLKDGIAMTKFMYWLKNNVGKIEMSEMSAQDYLLKLRQAQELFIEPSFDTISAYREHGAMMHYFASKSSNSKLKPEGMLLVDSGGQYYQGTTDVTRTFILGQISEQERQCYTLTLMGMLRLANQSFPDGCSGINLDILARGALWNEGIDYRCGTGHGVGYVLNVHEGPQNLRWKRTEGSGELEKLRVGMVITNEPGVYEEGRFGIRIENQMVVQPAFSNEYGDFLRFEQLTCVPIDVDGIDLQLLPPKEREWLNAYHRWVRESLLPYLEPDEKEWLAEVTRSIK